MTVSVIKNSASHYGGTALLSAQVLPWLCHQPHQLPRMPRPEGDLTPRQGQQGTSVTMLQAKPANLRNRPPGPPGNQAS